MDRCSLDYSSEGYFHRLIIGMSLDVFDVFSSQGLSVCLKQKTKEKKFKFWFCVQLGARKQNKKEK